MLDGSDHMLMDVKSGMGADIYEGMANAVSNAWRCAS